MFYKVLQLVGVGLATLLLIGIEILDWQSRMDILQNRWPRIWRTLNNRAARTLLLVAIIVFLVRDFEDSVATALPPVVKIPPPPAPQIVVIPTVPASPAGGDPKEPPTQEKPAPAPKTSPGGGIVITQKGNGPGSPNVVTTGANSPVTTGPGSPITINPAQNPNRPSLTYFCNGMWRSAGPGANAALEITMGGNDSVFQEMIELNNTRKYSGLLASCSKEIQANPDWLTPYLFCGLAHLSLGDQGKANEMLKRFDEKTGPAYSEGACKQISDYLHAHLK